MVGFYSGNIVSGNYTLTPQKDGFIFFPPSRMVSIPLATAYEYFSSSPVGIVTYESQLVLYGHLATNGLTLH